MNDTERRRRLKAIAEILAKPEIPASLRLDLEQLRGSLQGQVVVQGRMARQWRDEADKAHLRRQQAV